VKRPYFCGDAAFREPRFAPLTGLGNGKSRLPPAKGGRMALAAKERHDSRDHLIALAFLDALATPHNGRDPFGRPVGDSAERVVLQMGVALGGSGLTMPEHLADEGEAVAARYGDRGKAVRKVVKSDIGPFLLE
jgi:hypothetical protein